MPSNRRQSSKTKPAPSPDTEIEVFAQRVSCQVLVESELPQDLAPKASSSTAHQPDVNRPFRNRQRSPVVSKQPATAHCPHQSSARAPGLIVGEPAAQSRPGREVRKTALDLSQVIWRWRDIIVEIANQVACRTGEANVARHRKAGYLAIPDVDQADAGLAVKSLSHLQAGAAGCALVNYDQFVRVSCLF